MSDVDQDWYAEMAKLGALMSAITQDVCAPKTVDMVRVRYYNSQLKAWHDNLPDWFKLSEALESKSDTAQRTSILLTHCTYLGSLILLMRRVLIAQTKVIRNQEQDIVYNHVEQEMAKFSHDCIFAARQLATVRESAEIDLWARVLTVSVGGWHIFHGGTLGEEMLVRDSVSLYLVPGDFP